MFGFLPKFKHLTGKLAKKDDTFFNITPDAGAVDSVLIAANEKFWAVPWKRGGGPVYVATWEERGKVKAPQAVPLLNGHKQTVLALGFSPFDSNLLVTGSDDCSPARSVSRPPPQRQAEGRGA